MPDFTKTEILYEAEWRRCAKDPVYFLETHWTIRTPDGALLFGLRPEQLLALQTWLDERYSINLKARQIGWTTLAAGYAFWQAFFHEDWTCIFLSKGEREAAYILQMVDYGWRRLPEWLKQRGPTREAFNLSKMPFSNGSVIESLPSKQDPARGRTVNCVIVDEWAFLDNPEEAWSSIEPIADVGGQIIGISTANGSGNFFHEWWVRAETGASKFKALFFPWWVVPGRDDAWYADKLANMQEWQVHQEYPSTPDEAFIKSGNPFFDVDALRALPTIKPKRGALWSRLDPRVPEFRKSRDGPLRVFHAPNLIDNYVVGADVAEGLEHGDFSSAHVLAVKSRVVVAKWHGRVPTDEFAEVLAELGWWYGRALLGVESNNHGLSVLQHLKNSCKYPNLYYRQVYDERTRRRTSKMGWYTSKATKPMMLDELHSGLRGEGALVLEDAETIGELVTFIRDERAHLHGSPFDDQVISLAIANQMLKHATEPRYEKYRNDYWTMDWWKRQADEEGAPAPALRLGAHSSRRR